MFGKLFSLEALKMRLQRFVLFAVASDARCPMCGAATSLDARWSGSDELSVAAAGVEAVSLTERGYGNVYL